MISTECPCGRARAGCTYHDPALQPPAAPQAVTHVTFSAHVPQVVACPEVEIAGVQFKTLQVTKLVQNNKLFTLVADPVSKFDFDRIMYMCQADMMRAFTTPAPPFPFSVAWDAVSFEHHPRAWWWCAPKQDPVTRLATYTVQVLP